MVCAGFLPNASVDAGLKFPASFARPNEQGNPAAAKNFSFQNSLDPPLGLTDLLGERLIAQLRLPGAVLTVSIISVSVRVSS